MGSRNCNLSLGFSNFFKFDFFVEGNVFLRKKWFFIKLDQQFSMVENLNPLVISQNFWIRESHYGTSIWSIMYHSVHDPIFFCFRIELSEAHEADALPLVKYFSTSFRYSCIVFVGYYRWNQKYRVGKNGFPEGNAVASNRFNNKFHTK